MISNNFDKICESLSVLKNTTCIRYPKSVKLSNRFLEAFKQEYNRQKRVFNETAQGKSFQPHAERILKALRFHMAEMDQGNKKRPLVEANYQLNWKSGIGTGTSLKGELDNVPWDMNETIARLISLSHQNPEYDAEEEGGKVAAQFTGIFRGQPFTVYDYKDDNRALHIGGSGKLDLNIFKYVLARALKNVKPTEFSARSGYQTFEWPGTRFGAPAKQGSRVKGTSHPGRPA